MNESIREGKGEGEEEEKRGVEELLKKIENLEKGHALLKKQISQSFEKGRREVELTESQCENILESSMGQSVHMFDFQTRIIYWNRMAEKLYGYSAVEALGKTAPEIIIGPKYSELATIIIRRALKGENWFGEFPMRNRNWERFSVITTLSPYRDQNGTITAVLCICADARPFQLNNDSSDHHFHAASSKNIDDGYYCDDAFSLFRVGSEKTRARKKSWPWKRQDNTCFGWLHPQTLTSTSSLKLETHETTSCITNESCTIATTSGRPTTNINKFDNLDDVEISWEDLILEQQLGQGSFGTVYHAMWYGSDVAVKVYTNQDYTDDVILSFRKEVSLMKRLRHPNILLFMGAVTSPEHLCIVTEFLPRGSLFGLLQRNKAKLDWRRRINMAMDIARGMNYLHQCDPPIIHRDLKSSNLLVDKNWIVKVGDFGLSRIKRESYLTTKTGLGTPQWMAPETLRNEKADEKSDVYSYGVVLWEITTEKIPWDNLNPMQVIGAVGFMNQRLEIPKDVNPEWASVIESCWSREPQSRPTFQEILTKLKELQKKFAVSQRDKRS